MRRLLTIACLIMLEGVLTACFIGGHDLGSKHNYYTLYLEDVQMPDEIHANESFTLRMVFSASQNPEIFADNNLYWGSGFLTVEEEATMTGNMYILHDYVLYSEFEKTPDEPNVLSRELNYKEPGTYVLLIGTVADRSTGGSVHRGSFTNGPAFLSGTGSYSHREVVINVLP